MTEDLAPPAATVSTFGPPIAPAIPAVRLLGAGFLSRANLAVGWSLSWRVGLANGLVSGALAGALRLARGSVTPDLADRLALAAATTVAGLLVTDWAGRRIARRRYGLVIDRFVGWAITWREGVAGLAWASAAGVVIAAAVISIHLAVGGEAARTLTKAVLVLCLPGAIVLAVAGGGWAAHRVFAHQRAAATGPPAAAP
ncbi:MAG: hypothetical protein HY699_14240 [Deltaproteobacteria bacterium]|nr:hypothetical protein [Deltaproteobacteria bacterium]